MNISSDNDYNKLLEKIKQEKQLLSQLQQQYYAKLVDEKSQLQTIVQVQSQIEQIKNDINLYSGELNSLNQEYDEIKQEKQSSEKELNDSTAEGESLKKQSEMYKQVMSDMDNILAKYSKVEGVRLDPQAMTTELLSN